MAVKIRRKILIHYVQPDVNHFASQLTVKYSMWDGSQADPSVTESVSDSRRRPFGGKNQPSLNSKQEIHETCVAAVSFPSEREELTKAFGGE